LSDKTLILMVGLPRSGKSTMARGLWERNGWPIVSPDAIRLAIHGLPFAPIAEPLVWWTATIMVSALFLSGHDTVILDACNNTAKRRLEWHDDRWSVQYKIVDTPSANCVIRANEIGRSDLLPVIRRMADEADWMGKTAETLYNHDTEQIAHAD
jgi:predicted kinase